MAKDVLHAISDAEQIIEQRKRERAATSLDFRAPLAAEQIADELTRLVAEVKTVRYLLAANSAGPKFVPK
jgi:hypothetical protein